LFHLFLQEHHIIVYGTSDGIPTEAKEEKKLKRTVNMYSLTSLSSKLLSSLMPGVGPPGRGHVASLGSDGGDYDRDSVHMDKVSPESSDGKSKSTPDPSKSGVLLSSGSADRVRTRAKEDPLAAVKTFLDDILLPSSHEKHEGTRLKVIERFHSILIVEFGLSQHH
jgi:hypothetical protein